MQITLVHACTRGKETSPRSAIRRRRETRRRPDYAVRKRGITRLDLHSIPRAAPAYGGRNYPIDSPRDISFTRSKRNVRNRISFLMESLVLFSVTQQLIFCHSVSYFIYFPNGGLIAFFHSQLHT